MNFTLLTLEYPPRLGGAGCVAQDIANIMADKTHDVEVVTIYKSTFSELVKGVIKNEMPRTNLTVKKVPVWKGLWFISFPFHLKKAMQKNHEIILVNDFGAGYSFHLNYKKENKPFYMYLHGKESCLQNDSFIKNTMLRFKCSLINNLTNAEKVICVSRFISSWLMSNVNITSLENKVKVVPNIVDSSLFKFVNIENIPEPYLLKSKVKSVKFITVCRFVKMKGFDKKLELFKRLINRGHDIVWYIAGDGEYKIEFTKKVKESGLESRIFFLGKVERSNLKYYYSQCDVFWLLSLFEEAYPLVYHEAQACQLPVIGLNKGGVSEVINNGVDGFVIDDDNEFITLFENNDFDKMNMLSWDVKAHSSEKIYFDLLDVFDFRY